MSHPNVVSIFDYSARAERPYLVMSYIDGPSLAGALADGKQVDGAQLAHELLDAVGHVHAAGLVHRDITPGNVLLDPGGHAHLTDFGIAQFPEATALTQAGMVIGTRNYLAPEVVAGEPATTASDLYSVGRVLEEVAAKTDGTGRLAPVIAALTAENPRQRPASAQSALDLAAGDAGKLTAALTAPTRVLPRQTFRTRRQLAPAAIAAGVALLLVVLLLVVTAGGGGSGKPSSAPGRPDIVAPSAPLNAQLSGLDAAIERAAAGGH